MLNKKLVLGSLAGATLLVGAAMMVPATSQAGLLNGVCSNCHTMHDSQDGAIMATGGPNAQLLLVGGGCVGCHAREANQADGLGSSDPRAPQVGSAANDANMLAGGYFGDVADEMQHNVEGVVTTIAGDANLATAPGGTFAVANAAATTFTCEDCHGTAKGGHHTANNADAADDGVNDSYRLLQANTDNDGGSAVGTAEGILVKSGTAPSADRRADAFTGTEYVVDDATNQGINNFCADCHGTFHGTGNTGTATPFVRHPTGTQANAVATYSYGGSANLPLGDAGTGANDVLCITCHRPHGSGVADLLRFTYSLEIAGDATVANGCETCHGIK